MFPNPESLNDLSLDAAGLIAIADLDTITRRTAIIGSASFFDLLVIAPGIHSQQNATELAKGENPACAALTTGYVFRVENPATVYYLQNIGKTGQLVRVHVEEVSGNHISSRFTSVKAGFLASVFFFLCPVITVIVLGFTIALWDWWAFSCILALISARALNVVVIRRRSVKGWKVGISERGEKGKLLVLLSQDRWILMLGDVDDLKAVTAGQWLRDPTSMERFLTAFGTLLVFATAVLAGNSTNMGAILIVLLMLFSVALLGLSNSFAKDFHIHGCRVRPVGEPKRYARRLHLAEELIKEEAGGKRDWAVQLGLVLPEKKKTADATVSVEEEVRKVTV
ncbi:hypothetical protein BJ508DRAFT_227030 [Ascobolus immersus RN42]|uniref:Uncharacterized protein n=1 Tax=Ascobolus immersus RN42 TaxID=1160509 RepID=A0A3N4I1G0_ASCIM|nr:hypothetical protein BJ508DRAFT_227030 [Ascobolus immersus RN42]